MADSSLIVCCLLFDYGIFSIIALIIYQFRAPEEYNYEEEDEKIDIFSMGNIFYSIISGDMPFEGVKEKEAIQMVKDGERPKIPKEALKSDDIAIKTIVSVIKKCWKQNPKDRPSASSIRDKFKQVMDKIATENPTYISD